MKKIYLNDWVKPMAELHAICVVEDILGISQDNPKFQKEFEKAFEDFCTEFYEHSLIPRASNPTVPAGKVIFDSFKDDFMKNLNAPTEEQKKELYAQITRSVSMISRVLVESELGKLKYNLNDIDGTEEEKNQKRHDSVRNRYKRLLFICLLMGHIKSLFKIKKGEVDNLIDSLLSSQKWKSLQSTKSVNDFQKNVKDAVDSDMKGYEPLKSVKEKFGK